MPRPYPPRRALRAADIPPRIADLFRQRRQTGAPGDCWNWPTASYGQIVWTDPDGTRRQEKTHRIAIVLDGRELPAEMLACHRCDNPRCCNPRHLFVGTPADNHWDLRCKGRWQKPRRRSMGVHRAPVS